MTVNDFTKLLNLVRKTQFYDDQIVPDGDNNYG